MSVNGQIEHFNLNEIVTDDAGIMSTDQLVSLRTKLKAYEAEKTHQIVVLTINNLGENTIEGYALTVFNQNKLGQKDKDNGLLILFSKNDRKVRIEVGYGLEPIVTDALSSRIIRNIMIPEFKKERYFEGINLATSELIKLIDDPKYRDEFKSEEQVGSKKEMSLTVKLLVLLLVAIFLGIFIFLGGAIFLQAYKQLIYLHRGLIIGKIGVFSYPFILLSCVFPTIFGLVFILMPLGFLCAIIFTLFFSSHTELFDGFPENIFNSAYFNLTNVIIFVSSIFILIPLIRAFFMTSYRTPEPFRLSFRNDKKYISKHITSFGSSSYSSGSSSSSWSSSSSSSGGFSGGGGSSGGGGASGSW